MTLVRVLLAILGDAVMSSVGSTRQTYLAEFSRYLDRQGLGERPATK